MNLPHWLSARLVTHLLNPQESSPSDDTLALIKEWSISSDFKGEYINNAELTLKDFIDLAQAWKQKQYEVHPQESISDVLKIISTFNGFTWVLLRSENSYLREGILMRHCVKEYYKWNGETLIYSLRDEKNLPHATLEIREVNLGKRRVKSVIQISGKANQPLSEKYWNHLLCFLNYFHRTYWCIPNLGAYSYNNLFFDQTTNQVILLENLTYHPQDLELIKFTGKMPKTCIIEGDLSLAYAEPKTLSSELIIKGNLILTGSSIQVPNSWTFNKLVTLK